MQITKLSWLLRSITVSCVKLLRFMLQSGRTLVETCNFFQESSPTSRPDLYYSRLPPRASFMLCWKSGSSGLLGTTEEVRTLLHLRPCNLHWVSLDLEQLHLSYAFLVLFSSEIVKSLLWSMYFFVIIILLLSFLIWWEYTWLFRNTIASSLFKFPIHRTIHYSTVCFTNSTVSYLQRLAAWIVNQPFCLLSSLLFYMYF